MLKSNPVWQDKIIFYFELTSEKLLLTLASLRHQTAPGTRAADPFEWQSGPNHYEVNGGGGDQSNKTT